MFCAIAARCHFASVFHPMQMEVKTGRRRGCHLDNDETAFLISFLPSFRSVSHVSGRGRITRRRHPVKRLCQRVVAV
jgi:hypothetical protein